MRRCERLPSLSVETKLATAEGGQIFLIQSRPVTARGQRGSASRAEAGSSPKELVQGLGASPGWITGRVKVARSSGEAVAIQAGEILVAPATSLDWVPLMRRAAAIVTDNGGMTSHAAIVSRELGVPSIVGAGQAPSVLQDGMLVTVDATWGSSSKAGRRISQRKAARRRHPSQPCHPAHPTHQ